MLAGFEGEMQAEMNPNPIVLSQDEINALYQKTGITQYESGKIGEDVIEVSRQQAAEILDANLEDPKITYQFENILREGIIDINSQKKVMGDYIQITDNVGREFICKEGDIKNNTIDPLDIFVIKGHESISSGTIITNLEDDDMKYIVNSNLKQGKSFGYHYSVKVLDDKETRNIFSLMPFFAICRIKDLFIGEVPNFY